MNNLSVNRGQNICHAVPVFERDMPMRLGTKRKTFSEYVCDVARSTATFASTISIEGRLLVKTVERLPLGDIVGEEERERAHVVQCATNLWNPPNPAASARRRSILGGRSVTPKVTYYLLSPSPSPDSS